MMYRKNTKKSRTLQDEIAADLTGRKVKKLDLFLFCALIAVIACILIFTVGGAALNHTTRTDIVLSGKLDAVFDTGTLAALIQEFEEQNPRLRVRQAAPVKARATQDGAAAESGDLPADIMIFDDSRLSALVEQNALLRLDSFTEEHNAIEWAVPLVLSMDLLFYNIDLLEASGFDRPPKTQDELIRYAQTVSEGTSGARGMAIGLSAGDTLSLTRDFFSWLWAAGVPLVADGKPRFEERAAVDLVDFMGQLNSVSPAGSPFDKTGEQTLNEFAGGKLAMVIAPASAISSMRERGFRFGVTVIPGSSSPGKNMLGLSGLYAGISGTSDHAEEAWTFLRFLTEKISALPAHTKTVPGGISGSHSKDDALYAKAWEIFESSDIAATLSGIPQAAVFENAVREEMRVFFNRNRSARDTAAAIQKRWEDLY